MAKKIKLIFAEASRDKADAQAQRLYATGKYRDVQVHKVGDSSRRGYYWHVYPELKRNPARKVAGKSTTLRNMASVTVTKLPNGVVRITGRKMAAGKANPRRGAYVISDAGMEFQRTYRTKAAAMKAAARFRRQGYSKLKIRKR